MHDEAQDGLEVVPMKRKLGLLCHMHMAAVPCTLTVPQSLQPLVSIGRVECIHT